MSASRAEAAAAVRELGADRGLHWSTDEAQAVADQLTGTREGLRAATARLDTSGEEPASGFSPAWGGSR
jgi:hypothetical protein